MKTKIVLGAMLLAMGCGFPALALDPFGVYNDQSEITCPKADVQNELGLLDVMELAVCQNPTLKVNYLTTQVSAASYGQSLSSYLPSVDGNASLTQSNQKYDGGSSSKATSAVGDLALNWLLLDFGGRSATADRFKNYLLSSMDTYDYALQTFLYNVAESYYKVLSTEENYEGLLKSEAASKKAFEEANTRYKIGLVPLSDKLQAETAYAQARLNTTVAEKNIALAKGQLANKMNLPPYTKLKLHRSDKKITDRVNTDKIQELIKTALDNRPDYRAKEKDKMAAMDNVRSAKSDNLPTLSANAGASVSDDLRQGNDTLYKGSVGAQLSFPLFTGFNQAYKIGQARFEYEQADQNLNQAKIDIETDVWEAVQNYKTSYRTHTISQTLLKSAEESERVAFASYKVGKANIINLLDAQSQLASARVEYSTSFYNFLIAQSNLLRAMGQMEKKE